MERIRKWIMVPADAEEKSHLEKDQLSKEDLLFIVKLSKMNFIDDNGTLLKDSKPLVDLHDCLTEKSSNQHFKYFLELKAKLGSQKPKITRINKKPVKEEVEKIQKTSAKCSWDWNND